MGKTKRQKEKLRREKTKKILRSIDWFITIVGAVVFLLLIVFVLYPFINNALRDKKEISQLDAQIKSSQVYLTSLSRLDQLALDSDYASMQKVFPVELEVASFTNFVDQTATRHNLKFQEARTGNNEIDIASEENKHTVGTSYGAVSGPFTYTGTYTDIAAFLSDAQTASPYLIIVDQIDMKRLKGNTWEIQLLISGYHRQSVGNLGKPNPAKPFKPYTQYNEALQIIRRKANYN